MIYILSMYFKLHEGTSTFIFWTSKSNMKLDEFSWLGSKEYLRMTLPILLKWWKCWIWFIEDVYKFHMFEIIVLWNWYIVSYKYKWIFKYIVLAPSCAWDYTIDWNLGTTCYAFMAGATFRVPIPLLIEVWELHATPSWREPPLESLSRYIGLWGRLLVCLHRYGYYLVITWIWINRMHDSKLEPIIWELIYSMDFI